MSFKAARVTVSSAAQLLVGLNSTVIDSEVATGDDPLLVNMVILSGARMYLNGTSAGTTANSFTMLAFSTNQLYFQRSENLWGFTSAGVTIALSIAGGKQT